MKIKPYLFPALLAGALLALIRRVIASPAAVKTSSKNGSYDAIDAFVEDQMHRLNLPGAALAIVEGDQIVHQRGFGRARPGGETPTPQTPFFIGSVTKSITALAVMQLVEAGKIDLDAPVKGYLPWFRVCDPQASAQITVRHLLNQTSGMPMLKGMASLCEYDQNPDAAERQARALSTLMLTRPVGAKFEYSNLNYNVLGLVIEAVSGESYAGYIQNHIFNPLEMRRSTTSPVVAQQNGLAVGYRMWFGFPVPLRNLPIPNGSLSSGQLISTTEDVCHYLIAQLNEGRYGEVQILSPEGIAEMHLPAAEFNAMGMSYGHYAMGWVSQGTGATRIVSHSGDVPNFAAFVALVPEQKKGLVLLVNANNAIIKMTLDEMGMGAAERLAGTVPSPAFFEAVPWLMRGMLLIPLLQIADVAATLRHLHRWQQEPERRPSSRRMWGQHILLPLIPNALPAFTLIPMLSYMRGFVTVFTPDFSWFARVCGSFALVWSFVRTGLVLRALRRASPSQSNARRLAGRLAGRRLAGRRAGRLNE